MVLEFVPAFVYLFMQYATKEAVPDLYRISELSSFTQNGHAMAYPLARKSPLVLGVVDLTVADLALAAFERAPLALTVVDLVLAVFHPDLCQVYPTSPLPSEISPAYQRSLYSTTRSRSHGINSSPLYKP